MNVKITPGIWSHRDFQNATAEAKLAAIYLLTNQRVNLVGYAEISEKYFVFETALNSEALSKGFGALPKGFLRRGNAYWIRGFIEWQFGRGLSLAKSNMCQALLNVMEGLSSPWVVEAILDEYPELIASWKERCEAKGLKGLPKNRKDKEQNRTEKSKSRAEQSRAESGGEGGGDGPRPKSIEEVLAYALEIGLAESEARKFFDHYEANGWRQGGRAELRSWRAALRLWKRRDEEGGVGKKSFGGGGGPGAPVLPFDPKAPNAHTGGIEPAN